MSASISNTMILGNELYEFSTPNARSTSFLADSWQAAKCFFFFPCGARIVFIMWRTRGELGLVASSRFCTPFPQIHFSRKSFLLHQIPSSLFPLKISLDSSCLSSHLTSQFPPISHSRSPQSRLLPVSNLRLTSLPSCLSILEPALTLSLL
ncbi:hypothetical protein I3760_13G158600 [Carya illinoinensis]|nr:hypothetical protein I3760_13G158600 [Carya illinoinensis]